MKKFELSAYGVEEMNQKEMVATDGGAASITLAVLGALGLIFAQEIVSDWDNFKAGLAGEKEIK